MGYSYKGRLGSISQDECEKKNIITLPKNIKELEGIQITQLIVGNFHTLALSSKGKLFGWGENKNFVFGNLDVNPNPNQENSAKIHKSEILYYPTELPINKNILVR